MLFIIMEFLDIIPLLMLTIEHSLWIVYCEDTSSFKKWNNNVGECFTYYIWGSQHIIVFVKLLTLINFLLIYNKIKIILLYKNKYKFNEEEGCDEPF